MKNLRSFLFPLALLVLPAAVCHADNLLENGDFEHKEDALTGWWTDYAFSKNSNYVGNKERVAVSSGKAVITPSNDAGAKMECHAIKFEPGFRYTAKFDIKGGPYRVYFAGYKWKPGIRPHESPELGELRMVYKSKALSAKSSGWKSETIELPGVKLSSGAKAALKHVRFITFYVYMLSKEGAVDNVTITKTPDAEMKF